MKKNISLIILFFTMFACKKSETKENTFPGKVASVNSKNLITKIDFVPTKITIDLSKTIEGNYDDYFSLKKVIYLDKKSPLGQVSLIRQYKEKLFILDKKNTQQLFCFDLEGKLIWEFKSRGKGPLEYNQISDFVINEKKGTIDVLDSGSYKIINLDINTGVAKTEFKLGFYGTEMVLCKNGNYLIYTGNLTVNNDLNYKLLLANSKQEVFSRNLPVYEYEKDKYFVGYRSLEKCTNTIYFTETLNDTIYTVKNDTLKTAYYVDFLDKKYPKELNINYTYNKAKKLMRDKPYIDNVGRVSEKNGILNFTFSYKREFFIVFYDIKKKVTYIFNELKNGKTLKESDQILKYGYIDDGFVTIIEPYQFDGYKKNIESKQESRNYLIKNKPEMYNVIMKTDKNSNPVLFIYEFKKRN